MLFLTTVQNYGNKILNKWNTLLGARFICRWNFQCWMILYDAGLLLKNSLFNVTVTSLQQTQNEGVSEHGTEENI
jgi:hypothetical protein